MRINDAMLQQIFRGYKSADTSSGKTGRAGSSSGASRGGDEVSISAEGQSLQRLVQAAAGSTDVRTDRVAELKSQIQSGQYTIDPRAIANRMLGLGGA
ncbi:MAG: flagellar biosynthesis anti-sigma factor FlgM [Chloroflexota bacterium]